MGLEVKNLGFRYSRRGKWIFRDINAVFESGQRVGLLGESGAGKSTLAKLLAGYLQAVEGEILLDGQKRQKKFIGYNPVQLIHQHPEKAINPRFKMREVISEGFVPEEKLLTQLGIEPEWMNRYPSQLSGGELQRFCIARALGPAAKFIIADEISTMLDVITQAQIWEVLLSEIKERNMGLIAITHDRQLAGRICTGFLHI